MKITVDINTTIVFDLDDTLYNEIDFLKSAYLEIARSIDSKDPLPLYAKMIGKYRNGDNVFSFLTSNFNCVLEELLDLYRNHKPTHLHLRENVDNVIKEIKAKGGKIGVVTDGRSVTQRNKLKALGIFEAIDYVVISGELGTEKPAMENFIAIEEALKTNKYWYIADNVKKDFIAPLALGWDCLCLIDNCQHIHIQQSKDIDIKENQPKHWVLDFKNVVIQ